MIIILAVSCDQNGFMGSRSDLYLNQPAISMYDQLLLKGEVAAVTDQIVSDNDFSTSVERVEFGDYHLVNYYGRMLPFLTVFLSTVKFGEILTETKGSVKFLLLRIQFFNDCKI